MDADYNPNLQTHSKKKWKKKEMLKKRNLPHIGEKRKKSHFAEVIARNKPVFDPSKYPYFALGHLATNFKLLVIFVQMRRVLSSTWMSTIRWTTKTS